MTTRHGLLPLQQPGMHPAATAQTHAAARRRRAATPAASALAAAGGRAPSPQLPAAGPLPPLPPMGLKRPPLRNKLQPSPADTIDATSDSGSNGSSASSGGAGSRLGPGDSSDSATATPASQAAGDGLLPGADQASASDAGAAADSPQQGRMRQPRGGDAQERVDPSTIPMRPWATLAATDAAAQQLQALAPHQQAGAAAQQLQPGTYLERQLFALVNAVTGGALGPMDATAGAPAAAASSSGRVRSEVAVLLGALQAPLPWQEGGGDAAAAPAVPGTVPRPPSVLAGGSGGRLRGGWRLQAAAAGTAGAGSSDGASGRGGEASSSSSGGSTGSGRRPPGGRGAASLHASSSHAAAAAGQQGGGGREPIPPSVQQLLAALKGQQGQGAASGQLPLQGSGALVRSRCGAPRWGGGVQGAARWKSAAAKCTHRQ
jgi:hypothetical protein